MNPASSPSLRSRGLGHRSDIGEDQVRCDQQQACVQYPRLSRDEALLAYARVNGARDIFFLNANGRRCIFQEPIKFYRHQPMNGQKLYECFDMHHRRYLVDTRDETLAFANRSKKNLSQVAHSSESGWNLPLTNKRHILNLPLDLVSHIFKLSLVVPTTRLQPDTVATNWYPYWHRPGFRVSEDDEVADSFQINRPTVLTKTLHFTACRDDFGPYTEYRHIIRKVIDSTMLRATRIFYDLGIDILYGENHFLFKLGKHNFHGCRPTMMTSRGRTWFYRPAPAKPALDDQATILQGLYQVQKHPRIPLLLGWVYYDTFLRFLYDIGPANAARIRHLTFSGPVVTHRCAPDACVEGTCPKDDLVTCLAIYVPFIVKFCTSLRKLSLHVYPDNYNINAQSVLTGEPINQEQRMMWVLTSGVMKIDSLEELEILEPGDTDLTYSTLMPTELGSEIVNWFKSRTTERRNKASQVTRALRCEICGESHLSVECWNLCGFCGEYGHARSTCPRTRRDFTEDMEIERLKPDV